MRSQETLSGWKMNISVTGKDSGFFPVLTLWLRYGAIILLNSQIRDRHGTSTDEKGGTMKQKLCRGRLVLCLVFFLILFPLSCAWGAAENKLSDGQKVYVSVYSNIYYGDRSKPFNLAAMLSIRNTDPNYPLTIVSAPYYDSNGSLVREYVKDPIRLAPMASTYIYVKESDTTGGSGANFIVQWKADHMINEPVIESLMTGLASGQGISFICNGRVIKDRD
jgi:hypothetical protein